MIRFIHLSDLHFGTESDAIVGHLCDSIRALQPNLAVISGDFTQIGNGPEFRKAQNFIRDLCVPSFCVPGNHDISRYNLTARFMDPYNKYKTYITDDLRPVLEHDNFTMVGLNTARRALPHWNWANGAISNSQLNFLKEKFQGLHDKYRICVLHHPIQKAEKAPLDVTVFGAKKAMQTFHDLQIDLVLTGHVHHASITVVEKTVFASASTAISHRLRNQENGFNIIDFFENYFEISHFVYNGSEFLRSSMRRHEKNT